MTRRPSLRAASALALLLGWAVVAGVAAAQPQQKCSGNSSLPTARFKDNGDGTVTDMASKLMWMRCAGGQRWLEQRCVGAAAVYAWADAHRHADQVSSDGAAFFNDWRLPSLRELATITERACQNPRTNIEIFPDAPAAPFWSSTPRPGEGSGARALALSFGDEGVMLAHKEERFHLRLVRTGP